MPFFIETPRCLIREITAEDAADMLEMDSDPAVHRYIARDPLTSIAEMNAVIDFIRQQYETHGIGRWAVIDKATGRLIGWTGFRKITEPINGHVNHYDFGYRFRQSMWGMGYATETATAALRYGIDTLKLSDIYAMTDRENAASQHVLTKIGFVAGNVFDGELQQRNGNKIVTPVQWFSLPAAAYAGK